MDKSKLSFSGLGAILAIISSAVGLGNIWKFPTMTGQNGGFGFILVYVISCVFVAIPVLLVEFYVSNKTKKIPAESFVEISGKKYWQILPVLGVLACTLVVAFYSDVIGWVLSYFVNSMTGSLNVDNIEAAGNVFVNTISNPVGVVIYQIIPVVAVATILSVGAVKGVEKIVKISLPLLLGILILLLIKSLTMSGAGEAIAFLFKPDFSKITGKLLLDALGLSFFKLSSGFLALATYFAFFPKGVSPLNALSKMLVADLIISVLAGLVIFPIVFTYGLEPSAGPSLIFMTLPIAFSQMPFGSVLMPVFFLLILAASFGALASLTETGNSYLEKTTKLGRKKSVLVNTSVLVVLGVFASLSTTPVLDGVTICGKNIFDALDYLTSNIMLPIMGLLLITFFLKEVNKEEAKKYMVNQCNANEKMLNILIMILTYITPLIMVLIALAQLGLLK